WKVPWLFARRQDLRIFGLCSSTRLSPLPSPHCSVFGPVFRPYCLSTLLSPRPRLSPQSCLSPLLSPQSSSLSPVLISRPHPGAPHRLLCLPRSCLCHL